MQQFTAFQIFCLAIVVRYWLFSRSIVFRSFCRHFYNLFILLYADRRPGTLFSSQLLFAAQCSRSIGLNAWPFCLFQLHRCKYWQWKLFTVCKAHFVMNGKTFAHEATTKWKRRMADKRTSTPDIVYRLCLFYFVLLDCFPFLPLAIVERRFAATDVLDSNAADDLLSFNMLLHCCTCRYVTRRCNV